MSQTNCLQSLAIRGDGGAIPAGPVWMCPLHCPQLPRARKPRGAHAQTPPSRGYTTNMWSNTEGSRLYTQLRHHDDLMTGLFSRTVRPDKYPD